MLESLLSVKHITAGKSVYLSLSRSVFPNTKTFNQVFTSKRNGNWRKAVYQMLKSNKRPRCEANKRTIQFASMRQGCGKNSKSCILLLWQNDAFARHDPVSSVRSLTVSRIHNNVMKQGRYGAGCTWKRTRFSGVRSGSD